MICDEVPGPFQGYYDAGRYRESQQYLRSTSRFGWFRDSVNLTAVLLFWFLGGFPALDHWVRGWGWGSIAGGMIYIGILLLARGLLVIPFNLYAVFVIEERFGFNQTSWSTWVLDFIKTVSLTVILGGILLAGILAFFEYAGAHAWWYCWIGVTLFMLVIQFAAPTWILPLFNKFEPLEKGDLRTAVLDYARSIDFPLENVMVMDGSKRSSKSNAFFTGFGRRKRIVLFDTLIERHTVSELTAVLAHEMGHYKKKHILQQTGIGVVHTGILFFLLSVFVTGQGLFDAFYMESQSVYAGLIFFGMLFSPIEFFANVLLQALSRRNEYEADRFAVETTQDADSLINALKKLSVDNLGNLMPHWFYVVLNYSHPPIMDRIKAVSSRTES